MKEEYKYQTIQLPRSRNALGGVGGTTPRGRAVGSAVELLNSGVTWLNRAAVGFRVDREIRNRRGEIAELFARYEQGHGTNPDMGLLAVVAIHEWERPDATGNRAQHFQSLFLYMVGKNKMEVLDNYRNQAWLTEGPRSGWRRQEVYLWIQ